MPPLNSYKGRGGASPAKSPPPQEPPHHPDAQATLHTNFSPSSGRRARLPLTLQDSEGPWKDAPLWGGGSAPSSLHPAELHLPQVPWREASQPPATWGSAKGLQLPQQGRLPSSPWPGTGSPSPHSPALRAGRPTSHPLLHGELHHGGQEGPETQGVSAWPHPQRFASRASAAFPAQPCTPLCGDICTAPAFGIKLSSPRGAPVRICSRTSSADGGDVSSPSRPRLPTSAHSPASFSGRRLVPTVLLYGQGT